MTGNTTANSGRKALFDFAVPLTKYILSQLVTKPSLSVIYNLKKKNKWVRNGRSRKNIHFIHFEWRYGWFYFNHKVNRKLSVLITEITEVVKHEIKKQKCGFFGALLAPLAAPVATSLVIGVFGRGVMRAERIYYNMDHIDEMF